MIFVLDGLSRQIKMNGNFNILFRVTIFLYLILNWNIYAYDQGTCPRMVLQIFSGYAPLGLYLKYNFLNLCNNTVIACSYSGNDTAGKYTEDKTAYNIEDCVLNCCKQKYDCNVAFIYNQTCFNVKCISDDLCLPLQRPNITTALQMVLVHPTTKG